MKYTITGTYSDVPSGHFALNRRHSVYNLYFMILGQTGVIRQTGGCAIMFFVFHRLLVNTELEFRYMHTM